jgi:hypothetical protein
MKTCKSCKFWAREEYGNKISKIGDCLKSKIVNFNIFDIEIDVPDNVILCDFEWHFPASVGENFGCIHHEDKV